MNNIEHNAENLIKAYAEKLRAANFIVSKINKKQYNFEANVSNSSQNLKLLVYFGKKGIKTVIQANKDSEIYGIVNKLIFGEQLFEDRKEDVEEPENYIGTDESGKGDYFGPLVVAGFHCDSKIVNELKSLGVKDSKLLSDYSINKIADEIKKKFENRFNIIVISPKKYNELYTKTNNVNKLLGWAHAKVLENVLEQCDSSEAISDKFGDENLIKNSLQTRGKKLLLHQFTKAEKYTAVAAASILAREKFNNWFQLQNKKLNLMLPKGASPAVEKTAHQIVNHYGKVKLAELVKLHFKTTKKILSM